MFWKNDYNDIKSESFCGKLDRFMTLEDIERLILAFTLKTGQSSITGTEYFYSDFSLGERILLGILLA